MPDGDMSPSNQGMNGGIDPATLQSISGHELLSEHLGYWPDFHDFEVLSISLDRAPVSAVMHDLRATFLVFDLRKAPDDPERKQASAELLFESVDDLIIQGFNHQNPITSLSIKPAEPSDGQGKLRVQWGGTCMRHEVSFVCHRIAVVRVVDFNPFREKRSW